MNKIELIKKTAEKYGFNLEFRTSKILEKDSYASLLNKVIQHGSKLTEIDVLATKYNEGLHLVVECKGANNNSLLILVKSSNSTLNEYKNSHTNATRYIIDDSEYRIPIAPINKSPSDPIYTITGDFFQMNDSKTLKKYSKNDEGNNFYKAQQQIIEAIDVYSKEPIKNPEGDQRKDYIVPLIVTNSEIWVIDFNDDETKASNHKWVLHRTLINDKKLPLKLNGIYCSYFPITIVNINHLESALKNINKVTYESKLQFDNSLIEDQS